MRRLLPDDLVARFQRHGVRYDRWYRPGLDLSWQETFQITDPAAVNTACADAGMTAEWHDGGVLHTTHTAQATLPHPASRAESWFNQANLFHPAALPADVAAALSGLPVRYLPRNASLGDGTPISAADITAINTAFTTGSWQEPWARNDLVFCDAADQTEDGRFDCARVVP